MMIRHEMGAHAAYVKFRSATEVLQCCLETRAAFEVKPSEQKDNVVWKGDLRSTRNNEDATAAGVEAQTGVGLDEWGIETLAGGGPTPPP